MSKLYPCGARWFSEGETIGADSAYAGDPGLFNVNDEGKPTPLGFWGRTADLRRFVPEGPPTIFHASDSDRPAFGAENCYGVRVKKHPFKDGFGIDPMRPDGSHPAGGAYDYTLTLYAPGDLE